MDKLEVKEGYYHPDCHKVISAEATKEFVEACPICFEYGYSARSKQVPLSKATNAYAALNEAIRWRQVAQEQAVRMAQQRGFLMSSQRASQELNNYFSHLFKSGKLPK